MTPACLLLSLNLEKEAGPFDRKSKIILFERRKCAIFSIRTTVLQGGSLPYFGKRREVVYMSTYEVLTLLILFGTFLIALLAYMDRNNKRK